VIHEGVYRLYFGSLTLKLEVFNREHKLAHSLAIHQEALRLGLRVPDIFYLECKNGIYRKVTEWVDGQLLKDIDSSVMDMALDGLAKYVCGLYDAGKFTPIDCHFGNFVWTGKEVVYIDLKKLLKREGHLFLMAKICLKSCGGDRDKILSFLRGYSKYKDVSLVIAKCDELGWFWKNTRNERRIIEPVTLEQL
jgi:tRNA A-37 threonylcarbamoyl transferase component Bud32